MRLWRRRPLLGAFCPPIMRRRRLWPNWANRPVAAAAARPAAQVQTEQWQRPLWSDMVGAVCAVSSPNLRLLASAVLRPLRPSLRAGWEILIASCWFMIWIGSKPFTVLRIIGCRSSNVASVERYVHIMKSDIHRGILCALTLISLPSLPYQSRA